MFPNIGVPQYGWFRRENLIKTDDLGVPLFLETPICAMVKSRVLLGMGDLQPLIGNPYFMGI